MTLWHFKSTPPRHLELSWWLELYVWLALLTIHCGGFAAEAVLRIERRGSDVVLFITGGTSNVQYQVWTAPNPDHNVAATNWYYWRHAYSATFYPYAEMLVYGENTSKQPLRFFQIRGIVPDA